MEKKTLLGGLTMGVLLSVMTLQFSLKPTEHAIATPVVSAATVASTTNTLHAEATHTTAPSSTPASLINRSEVMPVDFDLGVRWGDVVARMVRAGAIDREKFSQLYAGRKALTKAQLQVLDTPSSASIVLNQDNAGLLLNLFWPLGIANKSEVLSKGPLGTTYKSKAGDMASTGGWTLAKGDGATYLNSLSLVQLTARQEALVADMARHIYRPCCNNDTYFPDCNHGAAMLGYIELAVAQGLTADQIYRNTLVLNAYWFPQNYAALATYYKVKRNLDWKDVDPVDALGIKYSSGKGSGAVVAELQSDGLLPKAQSSGDCGA
ncbi:MAG: hypothetical protein M1434_00730 [Chloroflexi bacterium]|nr:hypothetical protein [Chloroflexota bacterium]MCL5273257.1 hypothetical protein [Chloroflexota bacterium]